VCVCLQRVCSWQLLHVVVLCTLQARNSITWKACIHNSVRLYCCIRAVRSLLTFHSLTSSLHLTAVLQALKLKLKFEQFTISSSSAVRSNAVHASLIFTICCFLVVPLNAVLCAPLHYLSAPSLRRYVRCKISLTVLILCIHVHYKMSSMNTLVCMAP
jgi:hypothetical protein